LLILQSAFRFTARQAILKLCYEHDSEGKPVSDDLKKIRLGLRSA